MAIKMVVNEVNDEIETESAEAIEDHETVTGEPEALEEEEILSIGFEEDSPPQDDDDEPDEEFESLQKEPEFAKKARGAFKQNKVLGKENDELKKRLQELELKVPQNQHPNQDDAEELGPEPDLEDEECNFDPAIFKQRWKEWNEKRQRVESKNAERLQEEQKRQEAHHEKLNHYQGEKQKLKRPDYDDAENLVRAKLDDAKRNIILYHAKNPAALVYALGSQKSREKLNALSAMTDYAQFTAEMARMESDMKIDKKPKVAPAPVRHVSGSSPSVGGRDLEMEEALKKAERTGDRSEVLRLNRERARKA